MSWFSPAYVSTICITHKPTRHKQVCFKDTATFRMWHDLPPNNLEWGMPDVWWVCTMWALQHNILWCHEVNRSQAGLFWHGDSFRAFPHSFHLLGCNDLCGMWDYFVSSNGLYLHSSQLEVPRVMNWYIWYKAVRYFYVEWYVPGRAHMKNDFAILFDFSDLNDLEKKQSKQVLGEWIKASLWWTNYFQCCLTLQVLSRLLGLSQRMVGDQH